MRLAALALFAAASSAPPTGPPTDVTPLTVYPPGPPPKVVSSYPADGASVAPGVLVLKLAFDQPMLRTGFDLAPGADGEAPPCLKTPRLLNDGKTFVLLCTLLPGRRYALAINSRPTGGFSNVAEKRAEPTTLAFTSTSGEPVRSLDEAMKLENLGALDVPVQETPVQ